MRTMIVIAALLGGCAVQPSEPADPESMAVLDELEAYVEKMRASGVLWRDDHYQSAKEGIARDREKAWRRPRGECHPYVPCPPIR